MEELTSYTVASFIPFTADVYLRLIERVNAAYWPWHWLTITLGVIALVLAPGPRRRFSGPLLAILWAGTGYGFFQQFYVNLNWAGGWFAWGFYLEALLLGLVLPFVSRRETAPPHLLWPGLLIAGIGLLWPLLTLMGREAPRQLEVAGIHPDPTAILALGVILLAARGRWLWLLLPIPLVWCAISGLTLMVLELPQAWALLAAPTLTLLAILWQIADGATSRSRSVDGH